VVVVNITAQPARQFAIEDSIESICVLRRLLRKRLTDGFRLPTNGQCGCGRCCATPTAADDVVGIIPRVTALPPSKIAINAVMMAADRNIYRDDRCRRSNGRAS
jgi:hypothetical protein